VLNPLEPGATLARAIATLAFLMSFAASATAQEEPARTPSSPSSRWTFTVEPYLWLPSLSGKGSADSSTPPSDVEVSFADALGDFEFGLPLAFEARAPDGRFAILADGLYLRLGDDQGTLQTETEVALLEVGGAVPIAGSKSWDLIGGLRYVDLSFDVELGPLDQSAEQSWLDPWIGARGELPLSERWSLFLRGDVGGFGVGSQFTWQALAGLGATLGQRWRLDLGYRALSIDFDDDDLEYDVLAQGPVLGLAWKP